MKERCILCRKIGEISIILGENESSVKCDTCGIYIYDNFFRDSYLKLPEYERAMISAYTRECYERGEETPKLADPDHLKEIIVNYKNKTLDEKLDNLILYLKKKSRHFGDSIPWDEKKDYPITYSQGPSEFSKIREIATKKYELVSWPARGTGLELTDKGWKKGEKLEEEAKMELKEKRRLFLVKLWESTEGDENEILDMWEIGKELGFSNTEIKKISQYLEGENQIVFRTDQGEISISHEGVKEAEKSKFEKKAPELEEVVVKRSNIDPKKVFVVHGRNEKARKALFDFLRSVGIEPIEWGQAIEMTGVGSPYPQEVLDKAFSVAQAIVVLITGDDIARLRPEYIKQDNKDYENNLTPQARPNVIFEAGLAFGRCPDRTILVELEKERIRPFSDVYGRLCVRLSNKVESRNDLISRLETASCEIDIKGKSDWIQTGDFDGAAVEYNLNDEIKEKELKKEEKIELNEEHYCILSKIASDIDAVAKEPLFKTYKENFPQKERINFNIILNDLKRLSLIRHSFSLGENIYYVITDEGFQSLKKRQK